MGQDALKVGEGRRRGVAREVLGTDWRERGELGAGRTKDRSSYRRDSMALALVLVLRSRGSKGTTPYGKEATLAMEGGRVHSQGRCRGRLCKIFKVPLGKCEVR